MWLKRSTPQNIVIGGAAGALPPVIGWAAVTGGDRLESLVLFLIIFLWTPPHFWALSLYRSDDYAQAGVPMLPVVAGAAATRRQILIYSVVLALAALAPAIGLAGWPTASSPRSRRGLRRARVPGLSQQRGPGRRTRPRATSSPTRSSISSFSSRCSSPSRSSASEARHEPMARDREAVGRRGLRPLAAARSRIPGNAAPCLRGSPPLRRPWRHGPRRSSG